ncbi:arabinose efflux permease family protein [Mycobacterium sp. JS623]|nr:arabinose efflux permease family protein [Mycobacterium sp. JS623]
MPWLLISSWMWHLTRWGGLFLGTYLVTHLGGQPIANQFVGVAMFAPMLLGTYVSTRVDLDHRKLVLVTELVLLPISVLMAVLVGSGAVATWMVFPYELAYGFGGMVNMTAQRALLFGIAGPLRSMRVLNTELAGMASAMMLGPLIGGVTIAKFGLGVAFGVPAALLACSAPLLWLSTRHLPAQPRETATATTGRNAHWRLMRTSRPLAVILLVTLICNLCYFAFTPLVPVIAKHLGAGPAMAGVIGATAGIVQLVIAAALIVRPARHPIPTYTVGVVLCLFGLGILSYTPVLTVALLALGLAGIGQALFGSTQATLPFTAVAPHERAAALGLITTTIGVALPTGMVILGVTSSLLGAQLAMLLSAFVGLVALVATLLASRGAISVGGEGDSITPQPQLGERARLGVVILDDVLEPDEWSADVDTDELGGLLVSGDRADRGLAAADANPELALEDQDHVGLVDVEVRRLVLAEGDVVDRQPQRQTVFHHEAFDHQHRPADGQT